MFLLACVVLVFWMFWGQGVCSRVFLVDPNPKAVSFINMVHFFDEKTQTINFTERYWRLEA